MTEKSTKKKLSKIEGLKKQQAQLKARIQALEATDRQRMVAFEKGCCSTAAFGGPNAIAFSGRQGDALWRRTPFKYHSLGPIQCGCSGDARGSR